jgi:hypothetical protein
LQRGKHTEIIKEKNARKNVYWKEKNERKNDAWKWNKKRKKDDWKMRKIVWNRKKGMRREKKSVQQTS